MPAEMIVNVRYFAGARAAAGTDAERVETATLAELSRRLGERHGTRLARVLAVSSFLVDGQVWHERDVALPAGATVYVLPPFAGG
jgi:molybdopterin converting factor small subunit